MLTRDRLLIVAYCIVVSSVLITGCSSSTPEMIQTLSTVVITSTPAAEMATLVPIPKSGTPTNVLLLSSTPMVLPTVSPVPPDVGRYEDRGTPVSLLTSYFNAINHKEYRRAWEYWENPPNPSYEDFVQGYSETMSVFLAVSPPTFIEGAAGSQYVRVPSLMIATHTDGS